MKISDYKTLNKDYELIEEIGKGGMASVFKARRRKDDSLCAIKILSPNTDINLIISKKRFEDEIKLTRSINSDYVIKLLDFHYDNNEKYIVMEFVSGQTLNSYIEKRGRLLEAEVLKITSQILKAMIAIRQQRIFHRDLKSSNILIDKLGSIKVIDFGISFKEDGRRHTEESKVAVSIQYMAPELLATREPTEQSEIYAIAILMYEMLIGKPPFLGNQQEIIANHISTPIPDINKIHPELSQAITNVIIKASAKYPEQRFTSFQEMLDAVEVVPKNQTKRRIVLAKRPSVLTRYRETFIVIISLLSISFVSLIILIILTHFGI